MRRTKKAAGKADRKGLRLKAIPRRFPDDAEAEAWFIEQRWPKGICCPYCSSLNVQVGCKHKTMPFRCREKVCAKKFSVRTNSVMESSKIGYQDWLAAMFLVTTNLKSVSSMKLHRDLEITQKSAWFLAQRLRKALSEDGKLFPGPVEVDETYFGGKRKNMPNSKRKELTGRGAVGKTAVAGDKDRATHQVAAKVVAATDAESLAGFAKDNTDPDATAHETLPFGHDTVTHTFQEYVKGDVHTTGIETLWPMLKRAHKGTFHKINSKHLDRYVQEFAGWHNMREQDTIDQLRSLRSGMESKRRSYKALIKDNGHMPPAPRRLRDGNAQRQEPHSVHWRQPRRDAGHELPVRGPDLPGSAVQLEPGLCRTHRI